MGRNLRQQARMMDGMVREFIAFLGELFPFRLALLPWTHCRGHKESSVQVVFLENRTGEVEIGVDAIIEGKRDGCGAILRPASYADLRRAVLSCGARNQCYGEPEALR